MTVAPRSAPPGPVLLLRAAHIGPGVAVTAVAGLLAVQRDLAATTTLVLVAAVFTGQLTVGWGNDLRDAARDRAVGRVDKPLATGELAPRTVVVCLAVAAVACVALSLLVGWRPGLVHLGVGLACGHAYNLWFKETPWSWLPYAVAFAALPVVVGLAGTAPEWPPVWMVATAALLGVAAHLLNALPDLADDEATGVRGLPHRLGATVSRVLATGLLVLGSVVAVLGSAGPPTPQAWTALGAAVVLGAVALLGRGKAPFYAAVAVALVDVVLVVAIGR